MKHANCEACKKSFFKVCDEHKQCDDCCTKENLVFRTEGLLCATCFTVRVEKRVAEFDGDTEYESIIICPSCGNKYNDCWEWEDDEGEHECDECERKFTYERHVTVDYSTQKLEPNEDSAITDGG